MKKTERRVILGIYILLSVYVIVTAMGYPSIPGALGPGFFPILSASVLGGLSLIALIFDFCGIFTKEEGKNVQDIPKFLLLLGMLIALTLVIQYVNPWIGIFAFLCCYIRIFAKESWKKSLIIAVAGTAVVYIMTLVLRIRF